MLKIALFWGLIGMFLGFCALAVQAEPLQRLFMTPEQRAELDKLRFAPLPNTPEAKQSEIPEPPAQISFRGVVSLPRQAPVVFLDYPNANNNERPSFDAKLMNTPSPQLEVTLLKSGKVVMLKPGQVLETSNGKVTEIYNNPSVIENKTSVVR
ncbi:MAG: hypothetical protein PHP00_03985 [Thiotrichaceae bacterium]|nr:hypothetical protein [Thiotrichaceae bacterium]